MTRNLDVPSLRNLQVTWIIEVLFEIWNIRITMVSQSRINSCECKLDFSLFSGRANHVTENVEIERSHFSAFNSLNINFWTFFASLRKDIPSHLVGTNVLIMNELKVVRICTWEFCTIFSLSGKEMLGHAQLSIRYHIVRWTWDIVPCSSLWNRRALVPKYNTVLTITRYYEKLLNVGKWKTENRAT